MTKSLTLPWFPLTLLTGIFFPLNATADTLEELKQQLQQQRHLLQQLQQKIERLEQSQPILATPPKSPSATATTAPPPPPVITKGQFNNAIQGPDHSSSLEWGGYVKLDLIYNDYGSSLQVGDDTLVPSLIPLKGTAEERASDLNIHAKESRFWFKTLTPNQWGDFGTFVELDFLVSDQGDERFSNSYAPRLRHAYATMGNWLFGQNWSTFMSLDSKAETLDFTGSVAEVSVRQPQLRYTRPWANGSIQFALENPETTLTDIEGKRILPGDDLWPDLIARINWQEPNYTLNLAALVQNLRANTLIESQVVEDNQWGGALSFSGSLNLWSPDNFKWQVNYGTLGRYMTANHTNNGFLSPTGEIDTLKLFGVHLAYQHGWSQQIRSSWVLGYAEVDNAHGFNSPVNRLLWSSHVNLVWAPTEVSKFGIEYLHAYRQLENGQDGAINRIQLSGRYDF